jgi:hypothetical protein
MIGKKDFLLSSRESVIPVDGQIGPIYICTRNDDLESIIEKTPMNRREDLVFLQNGMLASFLQEKGLEKNTQGILCILGYLNISISTRYALCGFYTICSKLFFVAITPDNFHVKFDSSDIESYH